MPDWGPAFRRPMRRLALVALCLGLTVAAGAGQEPEARTEWPVWGADQASTHYSPLRQIHRGNVADLRPAWEWDTGEGPITGPRLPVPRNPVRPGSFENTPVVRDGVMYVSTSYNRVAALDPDTGEPLWIYDPRTIEWGQVPNGTGFVHRGVAFREGEDGASRVFLNSRWRLISVDAVTGEPDPTFGNGGEIDLTAQLLWPINRLPYTQTSPPVVFEDLVILGNGVWDGFVYERDPPGNVQAFDARTGELVWSFNLIPQPGEFGNDTWEDESWSRVGHTNVWAPMSLDAERGLVYLPVGTPSSDYYGGGRLGDNLFAESVVCLDARTGKRVWHFQTVRHGLWDYDLPAAPTLLDITVDGREIPAVAVAAKTGFLYVFDRVTGEPVWPIEDRPVPPSDVPGERTAATQPFPSRPAPFAKQEFTEDDVISFTPELREEALAIVRQYRTGPLYAPPSVEGTIASPGILGGANWGGAAADPETGIVYIKANEFPSLLAITDADPERVEGLYGLDRARRALNLPNGLPINRPPYGTITAVDLNTGEHVFQVPAGNNPLVRNHPALEGVDLGDARLGVVGAPGPMVTGGGLVFFTGGADHLFAIDKATGEELWAHPLGASSYANPMTYESPEGVQFVVVAVGRGDGNRLVAFSLPTAEPAGA